MLTIKCTYGVLTAVKSIKVSYDNELIIECAPTIVGTSGNAVATYNSGVIQPSWTVLDGQQFASIDSLGEITVLGSGQASIQASYNGYSCTKTV